MAGVISFSENPNDTWLKAGWVFRQILNDTLQQFPNDTELRDVFEHAEAIGGLMIETLPPDLALRVASALHNTVEQMLDGSIQTSLTGRSYGDARAVEQYKESLSELSQLIQKLFKQPLS